MESRFLFCCSIKSRNNRNNPNVSIMISLVYSECYKETNFLDQCWSMINDQWICFPEEAKQKYWHCSLVLATCFLNKLGKPFEHVLTKRTHIHLKANQPFLLSFMLSVLRARIGTIYGTGLQHNSFDSNLSRFSDCGLQRLTEMEH